MCEVRCSPRDGHDSHDGHDGQANTLHAGGQVPWAGRLLAPLSACSGKDSHVRTMQSYDSVMATMRRWVQQEPLTAAVGFKGSTSRRSATASQWR